MAFIDMIEEFGFECAIFNFMGISEDYNYLKNKNFQYIKVNHKFLEVDMSLDALNMINTTLDIKLIATSTNKIDLVFLESKCINFISGRVADY